MIFMCDKKCQTAIFRQGRWHYTTTALSIPKTNGLFCIRVLSENKKEAFRAPYLKKTAESTGVIRTTVLVSDVRNLKEVALSYPTGALREPYKCFESFDKAAIRHSTILHCEEAVADSKYS